MANLDEYETDELYLAAYLKISGCVIERRRKVGNKVIFVFSNKAGSMIQLREDFYSDKAMVPAHRFSLELQSLKKLLFELV